MKYIIGLFLCFYFQFCYAQIFENFEDGDFSQNPSWYGDTLLWEIFNNELHSNSQTANQQFYLQTVSKNIDSTQWEMDIKLEFNTSSTNYVDVFLTASEMDLRGFQYGYFIRVGNTQDEISLYRKDSLNIVKIIDGKDNRTNSSSNHIKLKVWKNAQHIWTLFSDTTYSGNQFYKEGETVDSTYHTSNYFGFLVRQSTASFFQKHYFDNIAISPYVPDTLSPYLIGLEVINSSQIDLKFNENINYNSLSSKNFKINSIDCDSFKKGKTSSEITLFFNQLFQTGNTYYFKIDSLMDEAQNIQNQIDTQFFYFLPKFRDIRITEFMADPTPTIGMPEVEFVEVWNASSYTISLKNWKIIDNSTTFGLLPDVKILPNEYLILCNKKDTSLFASFGKAIGINVLPNLNNDADEIKLYNSQNEIIDSLFYNLDFYQDKNKMNGGWTIELLNPNFPCKNIQKNFSASVNLNGGTPGKMNSKWDVSKDTIAPQILSIETKSTDEIWVVFDTESDSVILSNALFILSENVVDSVYILNYFADSIILKLQSPQQYDLQKNLLLTIDYISDCWGNSSKNIRKNFVHFLPSVPKFSEIIITEIMSDPDPVVGLPNAEYIEVYNTTDLPLQLENVNYSNGTTNGIFPKYILAPQSYLLITSLANLNLFPDSIQKIGLVNFPSLSNLGQTIYLFSNNKDIIHQVSYNSNWHSNGITKNGGWSLEMKDFTQFCQSQNNWVTSQNNTGGTPGFANSINENILKESTPKLIRVFPKNEKELWLYFDKIIFPNSFQNNDFEIKPAIGNPNTISYVDFSQKNIKLNLATPFLKNEDYQIYVKKIHGCLDSNIYTQNMDFGLTRLTELGDITLNEILFNPFPNGVDFVEIYNKTDEYLDLQNVIIANADLNGNVKDFKNISTEGLMLAPHNYLAITENPEIIKSHYPNAVYQNLWQINSLPSYNDEGGTCILTTQNLTEFDRFSYTKGMHHLSIDNIEGVSLEKIIPFERNTSNFWTSASSLVNCTPGYQNSQFMKLNLPKGSFLLSSPTVSPDGDGYEDVVYFQYKMPHSGYTGTIEIFDIHGIKKRTLINNELLATEGNIMFDGADNYGAKLTPGIYPIYFSYYNLEGNMEKIKSSIVVAVKF